CVARPERPRQALINRARRLRKVCSSSYSYSPLALAFIPSSTRIFTWYPSVLDGDVGSDARGTRLFRRHDSRACTHRAHEPRRYQGLGAGALVERIWSEL